MGNIFENWLQVSTSSKIGLYVYMLKELGNTMVENISTFALPVKSSMSVVTPSNTDSTNKKAHHPRVYKLLSILYIIAKNSINGNSCIHRDKGSKIIQN